MAKTQTDAEEKYFHFCHRAVSWHWKQILTIFHFHSLARKNISFNRPSPSSQENKKQEADKFWYLFFRWFNFEKVVQALVSERVYFLNLDQLRTIIEKVCFIEEENEAATMLDFYHDLGMIVKHRNTVVLRAQWLIDVFKQLITVRSFSDMVRDKHFSFIMTATAA